MAGIQQVSFTDPYAERAMELERRRRLAEMLQQQGQVPLGPTEEVGGWAIRKSPWEAAGKLAQQVSAGAQMRQIDEEGRKLSRQYEDDLSAALMKAQRAQTGTPASMEVIMDEQAAGGEGRPDIIHAPAVAPNKQAMIQALMGHPATRQMALSQMSQDFNMQELRNALGGGANAGPVPAGGGAPAASGGAPGMVGPTGLPPLELLGAGDAGKTVFTTLAANMKPTDKMRELLSRGVMPGTPQWNAELGTYFNQGGAWNVGPNGVQLAPGYAPGTGEIRSAEEQAKAANAPAKVFLNGREVDTTQAIANAINTGTANDDATALAAMKLLERNGLGGTIGTPGNPGTGSKPRTLVSQTGAPLASDANRGGVGVRPTAAETKTSTEIAEGIGKQYVSMQGAGFSANAKIQKFTRLGDLLSSIDTGKLAPLGYELAAYAKSIGIPISEKLDNAQAAKAIANELALELRNPAGGAGMPGAMSDSDREYLRSMLANLDKTPGANKLLIEGAVKLAQRDREVAELARKYKSKKGGNFDEGFFDELQAFSDANPLFQKKAPYVNPAGAAPAVSEATRAFLRSQGVPGY